MNSTKPALASLTILGALFTFLTTYFPKFTAAVHLTDPATQAAIVNLIGGIGPFIGLVMVVFGRLNASQAISGLFSSSTTPKPPATPPAAVNLLLVGVFLVLAAGALCGCETTGASSAGASTITASSLRMTEGKALASSYQAADGLAVVFDAGAKSGVLKGQSATTARQALTTLQNALSTASKAYDAGDATTDGQIASLAALLKSAAAAAPLDANTQSLVNTAIQLAQTFATAS